MAATTHPLISRPEKILIMQSFVDLKGRLAEIGDGQWSYLSPGGRKARTTIHIDRNWALVERALVGYNLTHRSRAMRWIWPLLDEEVASPACARPVLPVAMGVVRIRAEIPLSATVYSEPGALAHWIEAAVGGVCNWSRHVGKDGRSTVDEHGEPGKETEVDIPALCEMAGWVATVRSRSGETVVALPVRDGGVCHARMTQQGGFVRFQVALDISEVSELTSASQLAVAIALLRVAGEVRLVRASVNRNSRGMSAALDVRLPAPVSVELVNHALSALALAHQQIAAELQVLAGDDCLASAYLKMQGVA